MKKDRDRNKPSKKLSKKYLFGEPKIDKIGDIQLGECIGKGAFGRVYKGLNFKTGEVVAVKQISTDVLSSDQLPIVYKELDILQKLSHPHIVKFKGYHEEHGYIWFVLEFVESGSLNETMRKFGVFPEELLVLYVAQVLEGLKFLHSQNVVHRDIKGCNLLLTKQGRVKLADFGSCTVAAIDKQFTVVGTPFWMAPEIIEMSGGGKHSDIWSLGCTVIELLTGKPPYWDAGTVAALFKMVDDVHPPIPDGITDELQNFLEECFIRDINRRPGPTELLQHPWIKNKLPTAESMLKTPSVEEITNTIKEYNTRHTRRVDEIEWDREASSSIIRMRKSEGVDLTALREENERLKSENRALKEENEKLKSDWSAYKKEKRKHDRKGSGPVELKSPSVTERKREHRRKNDSEGRRRKKKDVADDGPGAEIPTSINPNSTILSGNPVCFACKNPITTKGRLAMDKPWHHGCLKCANCGSVLDEFIEKDGKPYCVKDFNQLFGNKCGGCGEMIEGKFIEAMGRYWHAAHFKCTECTRVIVGGFVKKNDKPTCEECFKNSKKTAT